MTLLDSLRITKHAKQYTVIFRCKTIDFQHKNSMFWTKNKKIKEDIYFLCEYQKYLVEFNKFQMK